MLKKKVILLRQQHDQELDDLIDPASHIRPLKLKSVISDLNDIDGMDQTARKITQIITTSLAAMQHTANQTAARKDQALLETIELITGRRGDPDDDDDGDSSDDDDKGRKGGGNGGGRGNGGGGRKNDKSNQGDDDNSSYDGIEGYDYIMTPDGTRLYIFNGDRQLPDLQRTKD